MKKLPLLVAIALCGFASQAFGVSYNLDLSNHMSTVHLHPGDTVKISLASPGAHPPTWESAIWTITEKPIGLEKASETGDRWPGNHLFEFAVPKMKPHPSPYDRGKYWENIKNPQYLTINSLLLSQQRVMRTFKLEVYIE